MKLIALIVGIPFLILVVTPVLLSYSIEQILDSSWRGKLYFVGVLICLPVSAFAWGSSSNAEILFLSGCFLATPFSIIHHKIFEVADKINKNKIREKEEIEKKKSQNEKRLESAVEFLLAKSVDMAFKSLIESIGLSAPRMEYKRAKMQLKFEEDQRMWKESLEEARLKIVSKSKIFYTYEITLGSAFLILLFTSLLVNNAAFISENNSIAQPKKVEIAEQSKMLPVEVNPAKPIKPSVEACDRLRDSINGSSEIQNYLSSFHSISVYLSSVNVADIEIDTLRKNTQEIIQVNSAFAKSLTGLNLQEEQLLSIQNRFLELSRNIYKTQYNKLRAVEQLKASQNIDISNLLLDKYRQLNERSQDFIYEYESIAKDLNELCG